MTVIPRYPPHFLEALRQRTSIADVIRQRVKLVKVGPEWQGLCPFHSEKSPSFTVNEIKGFAHCFGCGMHVDAIGFVMQDQGWNFVEAVDYLARRAGLTVPKAGEEITLDAARPVVARQTEAEAEAEAEHKTEAARDLLARAVPAAGTLAEVYWRARGITVPLPPTIRFMAALDYYHAWRDETPSGNSIKRVERGTYPCLIAAVKDRDGRISGAHRTWLRPDGMGKAPVKKPKKMLGQCWGGAIRLTPVLEQMIVGEGIETAISGAQPFWDAGRGCAVINGVPTGVWAAGSLGNLAGQALGRGRPHPNKPGRYLMSDRPDPARPALVFPPAVRSIIALEDGDSGDPDSAAAIMDCAIARWTRIEHRRVRRARADAGTDFNDMLRGIA